MFGTNSVVFEERIFVLHIAEAGGLSLLLLAPAHPPQPQRLDCISVAPT